MTAQTVLFYVSIAFFVLAVILIALAAWWFFSQRIRDVMDDLSGKKRMAAVEAMNREGSKSATRRTSRRATDSSNLGSGILRDINAAPAPAPASQTQPQPQPAQTAKPVARKVTTVPTDSAATTVLEDDSAATQVLEDEIAETQMFEEAVEAPTEREPSEELSDSAATQLLEDDSAATQLLEDDSAATQLLDETAAEEFEEPTQAQAATQQPAQGIQMPEGYCIAKKIVLVHSTDFIVATD